MLDFECSQLQQNASPIGEFDPAKVLQYVNGSDNWNKIECKIFIGKIKETR